MKKRITIIGLGLIGGSIGLALKQYNTSEWEVVGYSRTPQTVALAYQRGAIDKGESELKNAVAGAAIVIIAIPVLSTQDILMRIGEYLPSGCIVTDTASTKVSVMQWAEEYLPTSVVFVGGHPMAGKEQSGIRAADASLFHNRIYCLVKGSQTTSETINTLLDLVTRVGARPLIINAVDHDNFVAGISHLPYLLSVALVQATTGQTYWSKMSELAASGYRDLTRLASGDVQMHRDICLTNQKNIIAWIDEYIASLTRIRQAIDSHSFKEIEDILGQARDARGKWLQENKDNFNDKKG